MTTKTLQGEEAILEPSRCPQVAALKRLFEFWVMDRDFHDAYLANPEGALVATGLDVDPAAAKLLLTRVLPEGVNSWNDTDKLPETFVWYRDFVEGRARKSALARLRNLPADPRFHDWTLRQIHRCEREMGERGRFMGHLPVAYELSNGCSVGCAFCALSAGRLAGIFRHTDENAALWREVLASAHAVIGDAASRATLYCATEPLDNLDYERFLEDFYGEFGRIPQTTTAAATRDIERTRHLLRWGQQTYPHFDRLSVLSKQDFDLLVAAFSPEELIFTDLLSQFEEAPICNLVKAGRNRDANEGTAGTIACVSGFIVNMCTRTVRLVTPVVASDKHPTGELVYETVSFADGEDFGRAIEGLIERHMHETLDIMSFFGS